MTYLSSVNFVILSRCDSNEEQIRFITKKYKEYNFTPLLFSISTENAHKNKYVNE